MLAPGAPVYDNLYCPVCGKRMYEAVECRLHKATIHMKHCHQCSCFDSLLWHCVYSAEKKTWKKPEPDPVQHSDAVAADSVAVWRLMRAKGWDQLELAKAARAEDAEISRIFSTGTARKETIAGIAQALGCDTNDLLKGGKQNGFYGKA